MMELVAWH
jgi:hypothetical protein